MENVLISVLIAHIAKKGIHGIIKKIDASIVEVDVYCVIQTNARNANKGIY